MPLDIEDYTLPRSEEDFQMRVRFLHPLSGFPAHERIPLEEVLPHILEIRSLAQSAGASGHQLGRGRFMHDDILVQCIKWRVNIHQTHAALYGEPTHDSGSLLYKAASVGASSSSCC